MERRYKQMTVEQYINQSNKKRFWLCPNIVPHPTLGDDPILHGYECSPQTIPEELKDKPVVKHFIDSNFECIIWENVPFIDGKYVE